MHEQAILKTSNPLLGPVGTLVTVGDVQAHYPTTAQANAGLDYECADPNCGVRVKVIIPVASKSGRKTSPSPYFAARGTKHLVGCSRASHPVTIAPTAPIPTKQANSNRLGAPSIWIDPRTQSSVPTATTTAVSKSGHATKVTSAGRSAVGHGTSMGSSQLVERFARAWKAMPISARQATKLQAPWNAGGTYFSGFFPIKFYRSTSVEILGDRIFKGEFKSIVLGQSGYTITMVEKHPDGSDLRIWVRNAALNNQPSGPSMQNSMAALLAGATQPVELYAFGSFSKQTSKTGNRTWYALQVDHPHQLWLDI